MPVSVVDASALAALAFGESEAPAIAEMLENQTLVAPALVVYEVGNACWKKCRRDPASAVVLSKAFADMLKLEIRLLAIEPAEVLGVAQKHDVTFYDAAYLWLADRLKARLVTLDSRLQKFAGVSGAR
ncbi:MAG: type II toxin-antitoxin system VapC family toxin [Steroidobacteraceae bacterium]